MFSVLVLVMFCSWLVGVCYVSYRFSSIISVSVISIIMLVWCLFGGGVLAGVCNVLFMVDYFVCMVLEFVIVVYLFIDFQQLCQCYVVLIGGLCVFYVGVIQIELGVDDIQ